MFFLQTALCARRLFVRIVVLISKSSVQSRLHGGMKFVVNFQYHIAVNSDGRQRSDSSVRDIMTAVLKTLMESTTMKWHYTVSVIDVEENRWIKILISAVCL